MFTAVLIHMLAEQAKLSPSASITSYLDSTLLKNLFVYKQQAYADQVTVEHSLSHTSGVADYFTDPVHSGATFMQGVTDKPEHRWTPMQLLVSNKVRKNHPSSEVDDAACHLLS